MMRWLGRLLQQLRGGTFKLLLFGVGVLLLWGIFAPVGTLVWWLNQGSDLLESNATKRGLSKPQTLPKLSSAAKIDCYIVFFPGVGDYSADQLTEGEEFFLQKLTQQYPNCVSVPDVFPYSASNTSLGGQRLFAPFWTAIEQADGWLENADVLIKTRNLWRFAISADDRYGQVYNRGIAAAVLDRMDTAHPISDTNRKGLKVILIGTSGGAQVALGAAKYLEQLLDLQPFVVSIGGDFGGNVGFEAADRIYHLRGERDWIEGLSLWLFPSRWGITVGSPFNRARQQGRYVAQTIGPHEHDGARGYFSLSPIANSRTTYVQLTLQHASRLPIWQGKADLKSVL
jgi:hypothetical protein